MHGNNSGSATATTTTNGTMSSSSMAMSSGYDDDESNYNYNNSYSYDKHGGKLNKNKSTLSGFLSHRRKRHPHHYHHHYHSPYNNNNNYSDSIRNAIASACEALFGENNNNSYYSSDTTTTTLSRGALLLLFITVCVNLVVPSVTIRILVLVLSACVFGALTSVWLSQTVLVAVVPQQQQQPQQQPFDESTNPNHDGTTATTTNTATTISAMRAVSDPIRQGAAGFLHVQYTAIAKFIGPIALLIVMSYQFRPTTTISNNNNNSEQYYDLQPDEQLQVQQQHGVAVLGNTVLGMVAATGFCFGAICSALSGYLSMWVAAQSNIRVAMAAAGGTATATGGSGGTTGKQRRSSSSSSYQEALVVCFRGGAFSAVLNLTLCIAGITTLYIVWHVMFTTATDKIAPMHIPMLLVGYGFGASFVALFMQLGGGECCGVWVLDIER